jgi:hypothetical protein
VATNALPLPFCWEVTPAAVIALLIILFTFVQVSEPQYIGVFYTLSSTGLTELERRNAQIKSKSNIFTSSAKGYIQIEGGKSSVRFKAGETVMFIVKVSNRNRDPMTLIRLLRFDSHKDSRTITVSEASAQIWGGKASIKPLRSIGFDVEKYGDSSFKIVLNGGLPPGEYALDSIESSGLFCFGFDKP